MAQSRAQNPDAEDPDDPFAPEKNRNLPATTGAEQNLPAAVLDAFAAAAASIPEVTAEDAWASIVPAILAAGAVDDLDAPWRTEGMRDLDGVVLEIRGLRRAPSEYKGGLQQYLIVDAVRTDSGEKITVTTGSTAIVVQLVRAHMLNAFPLRCVPRVAKSETKNGYRPMHLEIVRSRGGR